MKACNQKKNRSPTSPQFAEDLDWARLCDTEVRPAMANRRFAGNRAAGRAATGPGGMLDGKMAMVRNVDAEITANLREGF